MVVCRRLFPWGSQVDCLQNRHNSQKGASKNGIFPKKAGCKTRKTRYLKNTFKKDWESHCLIENTHYFCTRNNAEVHRNPGKPTRIEVENLFSKKVQKSLRDSKTDVTFAPRNWATFLEKMARKRRKQRKEIFEKKTSKKACRIKKELLLLHPLIERKAHE